MQDGHTGGDEGTKGAAEASDGHLGNHAPQGRRFHLKQIPSVSAKLGLGDDELEDDEADDYAKGHLHDVVPDGIGNLEHEQGEFGQSLARPEHVVEDFLEQLLEGDDISQLPMPLSIAKTRIMPRIQPCSIFEQLDAQQVAFEPFVNNTVILYVIDMPRMTVSITLEQMIRWGIDIDELDRVARVNLSEYQPNLK